MSDLIQNIPLYDYGNYYNWNAATAGTGTYDTAPPNDQASGSVCPKGWKLPTGGDNGQLKNLSQTITNRIYNFPNNFTRAGFALIGTINSRFFSSSYWSNTATDNFNADYFTDNGLLLGLPSKSTLGTTIRCIQAN